MIFVAVEGTVVCFTKGHDHFISNSISLRLFTPIPMYRRLPGKLHDCQLAVVTARRQRIVPFDLRRASLSVSAAIFYNVS